MRYIIYMLTALLMCKQAQAESTKKPVKTVIIVGVDGLSPRGVDVGHTPNMNRLIEQGSYTFHARGVLPTSSSPNWASMISGAGPAQHGITSNDWRVWNRTILPSKEGPDDRFPTLFSELRRQRPDSKISVIYDWSGFKELFDQSVVDVNSDTEGPENTMERAVDEYKYNRPDLLFIHLDHVDGAGHGEGWHTKPYFDAVKRADDRIGELIQAIDDERAWDSTVLIVTSDHGGVGRSHGGQSMAELEIPWMIVGAGVENRREIQRDVNTYDTACTAAYFLGIHQHPSWIGRPVLEAVKDSNIRKGWKNSVYLPAPSITPPGGLIEGDDLVVQFSCEVPSALITYTLDGSEPTKYSSLYEQPLIVSESTTVRARSFLRGRQSQVTTDSYRILSSSSPKPVQFEYYEAKSEAGEKWESLPNFKAMVPIRTGSCPEVGLAMIETRADQFAIRYTTQLQIEQSGSYMLHLKSDDGSRLFVGRREIINNDGSHGPIELSGKIDLQAGLHRIVVEFFEDHGGETLELALTGPDKVRRSLSFDQFVEPDGK